MMPPMNGGMNDMPMDNSIPPMGNGMDSQPMEDDSMSPMDDMSGNAPDFWDKLNDKQKDSVKKYAESMIDTDDNGIDDSQEDMGAPMPPQDNGTMPMQETFIRELNDTLFTDDDVNREYKKIPNTISRHNPFVSNRK